MSDPSTPLTELGGLSASLGELLAGQQDADRFFADALGQFDGILAEFTRERERWQAECAEKERALDQRAEILDQQRNDLERLRESLVQEVSRAGAGADAAGAVGPIVEPLLDGIRSEQTALREVVTAVTEQLTGIARALADLSARQAARDDAVGEAAAARAATAGDQDAALTKLLEESRQEQAVLETELDAVRTRAAELAEALAEQKRQAEEQQAQWVDELRRQRSLLERLTRALAESPAPRSAAPAPDGASREVQAADTALESVMAQFEMLQRDVARRRGKAAESNT